MLKFFLACKALCYNSCHTIFNMATKAFGAEGIGTNKHNLHERVKRLHKSVITDGKKLRANKVFLPVEKKAMIPSPTKRKRVNSVHPMPSPPSDLSQPFSDHFDDDELGLLDSQSSLGSIQLSQLSQAACEQSGEDNNLKLRRLDADVSRIQSRINAAHDALVNMTKE